jgi:hypothetical protein
MRKKSETKERFTVGQLIEALSRRPADAKLSVHLETFEENEELTECLGYVDGISWDDAGNVYLDGVATEEVWSRYCEPGEDEPLA